MNCDIVNKNQLRRTKIICTIGPSTNSPAQIEKLILSGMDVARLNFSHGNHKEHGNCINTIRKIGKKLRLPIAIMQDLPGPKNRIGKFAEGMIELKKDDIFTITDKKVLGDKSKVSVSVPHLSQRVNVGDDIFLNDGTMKLKVLDTTSTDIKCQVMVGGMLGSEKGINIPNVETDISALTDDDWKHLDFGVEQKVDFVALSFVSSADDIIKVREFIHSKNANIGIIAKIERNTALDNLDEIIDCADGIMVARGDLGLEIPIQRVPIVQKNIINKCNLLGKPVIVATQMLESMVNSPTPNRPEVTDIANAIFDGADALMLSEETAIGSYPIEAVSMMFKIIMETEAALPYDEILASKGKHIQAQTNDAISYSACHIAQQLGAVAIITFTTSGATARRVARYRPKVPTMAITSNKETQKQLSLSWGVHAFLVKDAKKITDLFAQGAEVAKSIGIGKKGDLIVITGGIPVGVSGGTNLLKVETIC